MTTFKYKALKNNKTIVDGEIEASDIREARKKIRLLGYIPTKVYDVSEPEETVTSLRFEPRVSSLSLSQKISFTSELETLLSAGIPIIEALHSIETNTPERKLNLLCGDLKSALRSGLTFAQSIQKLYRTLFGPVYTALVKTGEDSGELEKTLSRMLILLRKEEDIKGKIINASLYPCLLIVMLIVLLIIFAKFVFPEFALIIVDSGADIPFMMQTLIGLCHFVSKFWWLLILATGAFFSLLSYIIKNEAIKRVWDNFILKVPKVSDFIEYVNLSNFMTVLHISYEAGVPLISGLELATKTVGNLNLRQRIANATFLAKKGKTLTDSFKQTNSIPPALMSMISSGEKSGTLGKMFHDAADVIDKRVDMALDALTRLFEPTVIIILGGAVAFVTIAFFQAYVSMLGTF